MRVLVTGGAGFIGSALANRLHADGHEVVVFDHLSRGKTDRLRPGIELVAGDVRSSQLLSALVSGADAIWHLAYVQGTQTFYADPRLVIDVALRGIANLLEACERYGGRELFLVSSSEAYQLPPEGMVPTDETVPLSVPDVTNPRYSYGGGKIASEVAAMAYAHSGVLARTVIVRPHNVYGSDAGDDHVIPQFATRIARLGAARRYSLAIQGTGRETRSFCHIDDCVDGLVLLQEAGEDKTVYHLGNPEEVTIAALAQRIGGVLGKDVRVVPSELPKGSPPRRLPDITRLRMLGYEPRVSLAEGLPPVVRWYAERA